MAGKVLDLSGAIEMAKVEEDTEGWLGAAGRAVLPKTRREAKLAPERGGKSVSFYGPSLLIDAFDIWCRKLELRAGRKRFCG